MKMDRKMRRNTAIIAIGYSLSGLNYLIVGIDGILEGNRQSAYELLMGVVLVSLGIAIIYEPREDRHSTSAMIGACVVQLTFCVVLAMVETFWWVMIFAVEILCKGNHGAVYVKCPHCGEQVFFPPVAFRLNRF